MFRHASRRAIAPVLLRVTLAAGGTLALTAATTADAAAPAPDRSATATTRAAQPAAGAAPAAPKARPIALRTQRTTTTVGRSVHYRGRVTGEGGAVSVRLQMRRGGRWRTVDRDRSTAAGAFRLSQRMTVPGDWATRVAVSSGTDATAGTRTVRRARAFRRVQASFYGPGLYGSALGCGGTLSPGTIGVAHKTLPCGTKLTLRHGGRSVSARVIDRGPYVAGRELDLTAATKQRLGFGSTGTVLVDR